MPGFTKVLQYCYGIENYEVRRRRACARPVMYTEHLKVCDDGILIQILCFLTLSIVLLFI
jgi:hypothetical protein